jgi:hypothetical protein
LKLEHRWKPNWLYIDEGEIYRTPDKLEMRKGLPLRSLEDSPRSIVVGKLDDPNNPIIMPAIERYRPGAIARRHGGTGYVLTKNVEMAADTDDPAAMLAIITGAIHKIVNDGTSIPAKRIRVRGSRIVTAQP